MAKTELIPLRSEETAQFIKDNQEAFSYGALKEFGLRDDHFEEDGEIISEETIAQAISEGDAYRIVSDGKVVGGAVIKTRYDHGELELLFISPKEHSKGMGYAAWCCIEAMHPEVTVWETVTPYFEKRNIHFYVNRCGFHITEFYNSYHRDPNDDETTEMFRFEKILPLTPEAVCEQIKRITYFEKIMEQAENADNDKLRELARYYSSDEWKRDLATDEAGLLPKDLRRGVLSEDGIYDLLEGKDIK